ncbi:MAG TPA: DNA repair protein RecO [Plasticicumulans sp.]|nr:DNA repair protein RecO [Plasticicumulans sp.]
MSPGLEPAWVLHTRPYRDTSLLLELLTLTRGRVGAVARGARGPRSRSRGWLRPFQPLLVGLAGRGELATLTSAEAAGAAFWLAGERAVAGLYLNELLLKLLARDDPQPLLLGHYRAALVALAEPADPEPALRVFECELLTALGYAPALAVDTDGEPLQADARYHYRPDAGARRLPGLAEAPAGGIELSGRTLLALAAGAESFTCPDRDTLREARTLTRSLIDHCLGGRPVRTRELARAFRSLAAPAGGKPA